MRPFAQHSALGAGAATVAVMPVGTQQIGGECHRHRHLTASHGSSEEHGVWHTLFFHQRDEPLLGLFLSNHLLKSHCLANNGFYISLAATSRTDSTAETV